MNYLNTARSSQNSNKKCRSIQQQKFYVVIVSIFGMHQNSAGACLKKTNAQETIQIYES